VSFISGNIEIEITIGRRQDTWFSFHLMYDSLLFFSLVFTWGSEFKCQRMILFYWQPGITTDEIDKAVHQMIIDNGAYPSPLGYCGYPKSVCTSVNECICHGIPDSRPLEVSHPKSRDNNFE
jgi:hypothetical protein